MSSVSVEGTPTKYHFVCFIMILLKMNFLSFNDAVTVDGKF